MFNHRSALALALLVLLAMLAVPLGAIEPGAWEPVGPDDGAVTALAEAPNGRTLYAGSIFAEVHKSKDGGRSWQRLPGSPTGVTALAVDAGAPSSVFAGTDKGLFRSQDAGGPWTQVDFGVRGVPPSAPVAVLLTDPRRPGTLWVALNAGRQVLRSVNGGESWKPRDAGLGSVVVFALTVHPRNGDRLYAATNSGVFASRDGGGNWIRLGLRGKHTANVAVDADCREIVHAVTVEPINHYGITADHLYILSPATSGSFRDDRSATGPGNGPYTRVAADPERPGTTFAATPYAVYVQRTPGGDWQILHVQGASAIQPRRFRGPGLFLLPGYFGGFGGGALLLSSDDGDTWRHVDNGLNLGYLNQVAADPADPSRLFARASCCQLWRSTDAGATWSQIGSEIGLMGYLQILFDPTHPGTLYLATALGLWKSVDAGDHWQRLGAGLQGLALDPGAGGDAGALYGGHGITPVIERSRDGGQSWEDLPATAGFYSSVMAVPPGEGPAPHPLYANGYIDEPDGTYLYHDRLRRSTDGGATWTTLLVPERGDTFFSDLEGGAAPGQPLQFYAAFQEYGPSIFIPLHGGVFRSTDGGQTWEMLQVNTDRPPVSTLALDPGDPRHLFAGTPEGGIFESRDGGTTWVSIAGDLPRADVTSLEIDAGQPRRLYVSLFGAGAYRREL